MNSALMKKCLQTLKQNNTFTILKQSLSSENDLIASNSNSSGTNRRHLNTQTQTRPAVKQATQPVDEQIKSFLNASSVPFHKSWKSLNVLLNCDTATALPATGPSIGKKNVIPKSQIYMNESSGDFLCLKCNKQGNWTDFKTLLRNRINCSFCQKQTSFSNDLTSAQISIEQNSNRKLAEDWNKSRPIRNLSDTELMMINSSFQVDFKRDTLEKYKLRFRESNIFYPVFDPSNPSTLRDMIQLNPNDSQAELIDPNSIYCLFEETSTSPKTNSKNEIFVTDSILNSLVLYEAFGKPAIVINSVKSVDFKVLAKLEPYDSIIFWQKDKNLSFELANMFNSRRCKLISYYRSAYESLVMKDSLAKIISSEAFTLNTTSIINFNHLKEKVFSEIANLNHLVGVQWKRFPQLNQILKGHRSGEFTIFTGPTGSGKTTFLSEYSIDLCESGVKTLWGSFEIKNHRLVKIMMSQFSKTNLYKNRNMFEHISSQFNKLPLYFMSFHGQETLENVLKTMSNAVVLYGIKHVIIDNLQFMVGNQFNSNMDRFSYQDLIIGRFRSFATNFDCHVTIVIHPRKEDGNEPLKISSIFGSAKSSQEADNILILQDWEGKHIQICKNRFDGELGKIHLEFNKENLCFRTFTKNRARSEPSSSKKSPILNNNDMTNTNNEIEIGDISSQIAN